MTRRGKCIRNFLLCVLAVGLAWAQAEFAPFTVRGMCREMGRELLMTAPEPVYVNRDRSWMWSDRPARFVVARSGPTWLAFTYRNDGGVWEPSDAQEVQISNDAILAANAGKLYLAGNFPEEAAAVTGKATARQTLIYTDGQGNQEPPVFGETREFPLTGEAVAPGVFCLPYQEGPPSPFGVTEKGVQLGDASREWYSQKQRGESGRLILHVPIPVELTLLDRDGRSLETLTLTVDNYQLH